ncbi:hypothetical protein GCM10009642_46520 [Nocardiopsis metallicus]|uniref:Uncharacterized protein n=1 Tax=Nocardiopsis metallicus TaxID=179819 RepID=A0A840WFF5_9ACTN|nr:hypothetical protein [Nocardiopsis metallicus]
MSHTEHWTTTPITMEILCGAVELDKTERGVLPHRLPARARARDTDPQLATAEAQPSGVRLPLRTRARAIEPDTIPTKRVYTGLAPRPTGCTTCSWTGASPLGPPCPAATP